MDKKLEDILSYFDKKTINEILKANLLKDKPTEIRLRLNQEIIFNINKQNIKMKNYIITKEILNNIFYSMCEFSINAYEKEISKGFITLKEGNRVGIAGVFNTYNNKLILKELTSLNIRINYNASFEFNKEILDFKKGLLISGAPHTGKTTILKSIIKELSKENNICVCDEREELINENESFDSIKRVKKSVAIEMATRTLNPQIIICDEIGDESETKAILSSVNTGVRFICAIHADSLFDLKRKPNISALFKSGVFDKIVILDNKEYKIKEIINV